MQVSPPPLALGCTCSVVAYEFADPSRLQDALRSEAQPEAEGVRCQVQESRCQVLHQENVEVYSHSGGGGEPRVPAGKLTSLGFFKKNMF